MQTTDVHEVHTTPHRGSEVHDQARLAQQRDRSSPANHEIHVARCARLAASDRAEDPELSNAMLPAQSQDRRPMRRNDLFDPEALPRNDGTDLRAPPEPRLASRTHAGILAAHPPRVDASVTVAEPDLSLGHSFRTRWLRLRTYVSISAALGSRPKESRSRWGSMRRKFRSTRFRNAAVANRPEVSPVGSSPHQAVTQSDHPWVSGKRTEFADASAAGGSWPSRTATPARSTVECGPGLSRREADAALAVLPSTLSARGL